MKYYIEKENREVFIYTEGDNLLMEWPSQDATSGKESDEVDDNEQLSVNKGAVLFQLSLDAHLLVTERETCLLFQLD